MVEKPKRKSGAQRARAKQQAEGEQVAQAIIQLLNMGAVAATGQFTAAMQPPEQERVEPPLSRILARMDAGALDKFKAVSDPVLLAFGLGMWGIRVASLVALSKQAQAVTGATSRRPSPRPPAPPQATPAPNGVSPTATADDSFALSPALRAILDTHTGGV